MSLMPVFDEMKRFVKFDTTDERRLAALAPAFATAGPAITDEFYENLARFPDTAKQIEGRVDALKATHARWMGELFSGNYGEKYFESRWRIGLAHVRINLPPQYVEGVMSFLRTSSLPVVQAAFPDASAAAGAYASVVKILDLDLMIINLAYGEDRLDRVVAATGMSRKLIENLVKFGKSR